MRYLRLALAVVIGYAIVAGGLSLLVMTWWINGTLPVNVAWIPVILVALLVTGWIAGRVAALVAADLEKPAVYLVAGLTVAILTMNIILDVAAEPLWFKVCAMGLIVAGDIAAVRRSKRSSPES